MVICDLFCADVSVVMCMEWWYCRSFIRWLIRSLCVVTFLWDERPSKYRVIHCDYSAFFFLWQWWVTSCTYLYIKFIRAQFLFLPSRKGCSDSYNRRGLVGEKPNVDTIDVHVNCLFTWCFIEYLGGNKNSEKPHQHQGWLGWAQWNFTCVFGSATFLYVAIFNSAPGVSSFSFTENVSALSKIVSHWHVEIYQKQASGLETG